MLCYKEIHYKNLSKCLYILLVLIYFEFNFDRISMSESANIYIETKKKIENKLNKWISSVIFRTNGYRNHRSPPHHRLLVHDKLISKENFDKKP